jgi:hypothetical protein
MSLILFLSTLDSSIPISSSCFHQEFPPLLHIRQFEVVLTSFIHGTCLLFSTQDRILWPFFLHSSSMFSCCGLSRYAAKASVQNRDIRYETEHKPLITLLTVLFLNKHTLTLSMFKQRAFLLHIIYYTLYLDSCVCVCVFLTWGELGFVELGWPLSVFTNDAPKWHGRLYSDLPQSFFLFSHPARNSSRLKLNIGFCFSCCFIFNIRHNFFFF